MNAISFELNNVGTHDFHLIEPHGERSTVRCGMTKTYSAQGNYSVEVNNVLVFIIHLLNGDCNITKRFDTAPEGTSAKVTTLMV